MKIFEIEPGLFIWSVFTFLLLVFLLYKFAYGPLIELQRQRQEEIHESIREAERLREEARALIEDYRAQMAEARGDAEEILEQAHKVGESTRNEILTEARVQGERNVEKAREQIERETRQALRQIKREVADLTVAATEKVTRRTLSDQDHMRMIKEAIDEIDVERLGDKN